MKAKTHVQEGEKALARLHKKLKGTQDPQEKAQIKTLIERTTQELITHQKLRV